MNQALLPRVVAHFEEARVHSGPRAGWYEDPASRVWLRYWDGSRWADDLAPAPPPTSVRLGSVEGLDRNVIRGDGPRTLRLNETARIALMALAGILTSILVVAIGIAITT